MEQRRWIESLFSSIDEMNTDGFVSYLTEDALMRFGNGPTMSGKSQIFDGIEQFFSSIDGLDHDIDHLWDVDGAVIVEGRVTYSIDAETTMTFPFCNVLHLEDGEDEKVERYFVYIDQSPLFAES